LVYSQLWLNLFFDDHHFGFITILAKNRKWMWRQGFHSFIVPNAQTSSLYNQKNEQEKRGCHGMVLILHRVIWVQDWYYVDIGSSHTSLIVSLILAQMPILSKPFPMYYTNTNTNQPFFFLGKIHQKNEIINQKFNNEVILEVSNQ